MTRVGAHREIQGKLVAFLFNRRADALRGEMYRGLCLHVLGEADDGCSCQEVTELIAYVLSAQASAGLQTIVSQELDRLVDEGAVILEDQRYRLAPQLSEPLPNEEGQQHLEEALRVELREVALSLNPAITHAQLQLLRDFYLEFANVVAQHQLAFVAAGYGVQEVRPNSDEFVASLVEWRERNKLDEFVDPDEFLVRALARPIPADYLYRVIQVQVIMQLLAWDPDLEYLQHTILAGKVLYIDTNVLFALMLTTHPLHQFVTSLLGATSGDLHVELVVHDITLTEYEEHLRWESEQYTRVHRDLREVARICKRDSESPADYIEESVYADFVSNNLDHVDLGTWTRYVNSIGGNALRQKLAQLSVRVDRSPIHVPRDQFEAAREGLIRASKEQMRRGKRPDVKRDPVHDAKLFFQIISTRTKRDGGTSLGYDRYLLTLDGSLVHFRSYMQLPLTETYFMFPNQWYELSFPFLRIRTRDNPRFAAGLVSLVLSGTFPALHALIPLELCGYVFDQGGVNLPMGSLRQVVEKLVEERLIDSLDPQSQDWRKREEGQLRVARIIAEEEMKWRGQRQAHEEQAQALRDEHVRLQESVANLTASEARLSAAIDEKSSQLGLVAETGQAVEAIRADYERQLSEASERHAAELAALRAQSELDKESAATARERALQSVQETVESVKRMITEEREEKNKERIAESERHRRQMLRLVRFSIAGLMLVGLLFILGFLIFLKIELWAVIACVGLMVLGLVLYSARARPIWALLTYSAGLLVAAAAIFIWYRSEILLWVLPVALDLVMFALDWGLRREAAGA